MDKLSGFVKKRVAILTRDGRLIVGTLKGFDQGANVILSNSEERVFRTDLPNETSTIIHGRMMDTLQMGSFILKGDSIVLVGEIDEEKDKKIDWENRKKPYPSLPIA